MQHILVPGFHRFSCSSNDWVAGYGNENINLTSVQAFYIYLPESFWRLMSGPILTFDQEAD